MNVVACRQFKTRVVVSLVVLFSICFVVGAAAVTDTAVESSQQQMGTMERPALNVSVAAVIAAAAAFAFGAIGAGIAIAHVGAAAVAAVGEKPEIAGQALIFVALAEGIVVFGFITSLMILSKA